MVLSGCSKDSADSGKTEIKKIADYLYEYEADGYGTEPPSQFPTDGDPFPVFSCSSVRNENFYGRNLDFYINEICEFVIRTKARPGRKHASIGVANPTFKTITNDMVQHGLSQELINFIPWLTMDGINDAGLVCNINVVNKDDIKSYPHEHTNAGKPKIMVMNLVRALLDNCGSVEEAKEFIADHDITPIPAGWDGHIMIADPSTTVIAEFTGEKGAEVKYTETEIMTNFYNHIYAATGKYPPHGCGTERYDILKAGYESGNSMNGMWELLKRVRYTKTYKTSTDPFWCSDLYDQIPTFDQHPVEYWTKEKILEQEKPAR